MTLMLLLMALRSFSSILCNQDANNRIIPKRLAHVLWKAFPKTCFHCKNKSDVMYVSFFSFQKRKKLLQDPLRRA
jgi:hypothetical protein